MKFLQKLGKAIMLPVACLPLCGILMGIGYLLCPASMQGGDVSGAGPVIGMFLVRAGSALIDNIALLFAVGVGVGMADDRDGTSGLAALVSWLTITILLQPDAIQKIYPLSENAALAFQKIQNPFIGILAGLIGAACYNRFKGTKLPEWLAFFSGKRSAVLISGLCSIIISAILLFAWPVLFGGLIRLGLWIAGLGPVGAGLYAFFNRLLIPFGLHHALNNVFWFDTIGLGDLTHFWAGHTSADVSWSLGMYMSGFFPCMMFGVPGAAIAMIRSARSGKKKAAIGILASAAVCAFVCGVTEPFEFAFMFAAPVLYVIYALLYGIFCWATAILGFRAGFAFSAGATDLVFSASLPAAHLTSMILPLGAAAFVIFYLIFRFMITKFDMKTPGREPEENIPENKSSFNTAGSSAAGANNATGSGAPADNGNTADNSAPGKDRNADGSNAVNNSGRINNSNNADSSAYNTGTGSNAGNTAAGIENPVADEIVDGFNITAILRGLGGKENIASLDNCITRLRVEVKDPSIVNDDILRGAGAKGVIRPGKTSIQVVIGLKVQGVADAVRQKLN